jgi:uncharacterized membrane protein YjjP (DUF1212 family)
MQFAANTFEIPISAFYLPSNIMMNIGDGSSQHPSRTSFMAVPSTFNMFKLQKIDKLARDLMKHLERHQQELLNKQPNTSGSSISVTPSIMLQELKYYEEIAEKLREYVTMADPYPQWLTTICAALQCAFVVILFFKGSGSDVMTALIMGASSNILQFLADRRQFTQGTTIFISMFIAFLCRMLQNRVFWEWTGTRGFCYDSVVFAALALYMPGFQFTLSILEVGAGQPVAGAVRLFLGFMRSFQVGYGVSMGSKMAVYILEWGQIWSADDSAAVCPKPQELLAVDWWRYLFFIPMSFGMMVILKSHYKQWPHMLCATATCFVVRSITKVYLSNEFSVVLSSFFLGLVANLFARFKDQIAIATLFAGIFWLVPGSLGVRGATAAIANDGGAEFAMQILLQVISISIGL